ncbi:MULTISPECIES: hypothetical protein [Gordonia]|uniref:hypothetical protein n=1 Tax=Gordonia TaxID=2053 RepID=UPI0009662D76|nr:MULTISPECIES: hypothetical protein [Gordonia]AZZ83805.1 hypothetical protein C5O27_16545 [Gordonia alkanivorans]MDH3006882.1 hypothetical protein [Gordonia alkanivorans]MDH3011796.1 hypothetical protein [Gordonia alkanivorans]MDH3016495.1 hypothetical protein [Gordonia alkanivorans]MDH3024562.1 hypothetical protein [Gordonia alkanivorans]
MHIEVSPLHRHPVARLRSGPVAVVLAMVAALALTVGIAPRAAAAPGSTTGFDLPFSGAPAFERVAPPKLTDPSQLNRPLGPAAADRVAAAIGLSPKDALSEQQYRALLTGGGIGGSRDAAKIIDACLLILTNTTGRPMFGDSVVGSYGLYVDAQGMLQSPANASAPTRQVNSLIAPGGYVGTWLRNNGATDSLIALYRSAYTIEVPFGFVAQQMSGTAQLVTNTKAGLTSTVGMSMAPPLWIVNFALLYIVKPSLAAAMPAYWAPIPQPVAAAITASPDGQVPYSKYASYFE